ncbi:hypothetical protein GW17_00007941 [Ensete ventricosum]|nr:hypothetical protein GW17_00007941 [Ensete ventricosum]
MSRKSPGGDHDPINVLVQPRGTRPITLSPKAACPQAVPLWMPPLFGLVVGAAPVAWLRSAALAWALDAANPPPPPPPLQRA